MAPRATAAQKGKQKRARSNSPEPVEQAPIPRTVSERAVLGQSSLHAIHANKNDGEAWGILQRVMTAAHVFCDTFIQDERVVDGWITRLTKAGWRYHDSAWEPAKKAPSNKVLTTMLSVASEFCAFYAALSSPVAPAAPAAPERQIRFADDEDATEAALLAAATIAANRAAAEFQGPATAGGGGAGPSGVANGRPPPGGASGAFGGGPPGAFGGARDEPPRSMPSLAQLRADAGLMYGVNTIRQGGSAEELNLQTAPGGFPEVDFSELHGGTDGIELDRDNRIVLRKGKKAPTDKESFVEALKAELRKMKASSDPLYDLQFEYVEKLRTFLDQDISYKEVIAIDRKVRTRWGTRGVASYNEDMVDLVATMHNLTKVRTELGSTRPFRAGDDSGGYGGGRQGRRVKQEVDEQKPGRAQGLPSKICHPFNKQQGCTRTACTYLHVCSVCGSKAHGSHVCKGNK